MQKLKTVHPGGILLEEFLVPLEISAQQLAEKTLLPRSIILSIIDGSQRITTDTATRFSKFFGTGIKFWLGLQDDFDREKQDFN